MYAVEFETTIKGCVVQIPEAFRELHFSKKAKIIIMVEEESRNAFPRQADLIEALADNPRHIDASTGFLSREHANER